MSAIHKLASYALQLDFARKETKMENPSTAVNARDTKQKAATGQKSERITASKWSDKDARVPMALQKKNETQTKNRHPSPKSTEKTAIGTATTKKPSTANGPSKTTHGE